jgi:hypothetical protein
MRCYEDLLLKFNELRDMVTLLVNSKESGGTSTIGKGAHMRSPILRSVSTMSSSTSVDQTQVSAVSHGGKKKAAAAANGSLAPSPKKPRAGQAASATVETAATIYTAATANAASMTTPAWKQQPNPVTNPRSSAPEDREAIDLTGSPAADSVSASSVLVLANPIPPPNPAAETLFRMQLGMRAVSAASIAGVCLEKCIEDMFLSGALRKLAIPGEQRTATMKNLWDLKPRPTIVVLQSGRGGVLTKFQDGMILVSLLLTPENYRFLRSCDTGHVEELHRLLARLKWRLIRARAYLQGKKHICPNTNTSIGGTSKVVLQNYRKLGPWRGQVDIPIKNIQHSSIPQPMDEGPSIPNGCHPRRNGQTFANYLYENIRIEKKQMKHPHDEDLE